MLGFPEKRAAKKSRVNEEFSERRRRSRKKVQKILSGGKTQGVILEIREVQGDECWGCPWTFGRNT